MEEFHRRKSDILIRDDYDGPIGRGTLIFLLLYGLLLLMILGVVIEKAIT